MSRRIASNKDGHEAGYSVVSYFAGCGGMDLGFLGGFEYKGKKVRRTKFNILAAYDNNPQCVETYRTNIADHAFTHDLSDIKISEVPKADLLIGGFPCQDFSVCGPRKGLNSQRGRLYEAMISYAKEHRPLLVVAENVANLVSLNDGWDMRKIKKDFKGAGYSLHTWVMRAHEYGIPQYRSRVFLIFVREGIQSVPSQPKPSREKVRSIKWAISDLARVADESVFNQSQYFKAGLARKGHGQGDEKSHAQKPAYTVRSNAKSRIQFHYELKRRLTVRECARIQTFPDGFLFPHDATPSIAQIGNAVPPLLANRVAFSLQRFLEGLKKHTGSVKQGVLHDKAA